MSSDEERLYGEVRYEISAYQRAFLIGTVPSSSDRSQGECYLEELSELANTAGLTVVGSVLVVVKRPHPATLLGKGKLTQLLEEAQQLTAELILFDEDLNPRWQRELERFFSRPVIDRTELILEIFSQRAQTKEASLQIELAKSSYQLPRLRRLWTHLSRQVGGGKGHLKGEGERQLELDKRMVRSRIASLKDQIAQVKEQRTRKRYARLRSDLPSFALVGYTNSGKSTLLNALTGADVVAEDKLFATLDTKARLFHLPGHQRVLLVDTVGFIRKLPHALIAAFRSTLEEALYTDILLHLVDISHPQALEHAAASFSVLEELHICQKKVIMVLTKVDLLEDRSRIELFRGHFPKVVPISSQERWNFEELFELMAEAIADRELVRSLRIPQERYALVGKLIEEGTILRREYEGNDLLLEVRFPAHLKRCFDPFVIGEE